MSCADGDAQFPCYGFGWDRGFFDSQVAEDSIAAASVTARETHSRKAENLDVAAVLKKAVMLNNKSRDIRAFAIFQKAMVINERVRAADCQKYHQERRHSNPERFSSGLNVRRVLTHTFGMTSGLRQASGTVARRPASMMLPSGFGEDDIPVDIDSLREAARYLPHLPASAPATSASPIPGSITATSSTSFAKPPVAEPPVEKPLLQAPSPPSLQSPLDAPPVLASSILIPGSITVASSIAFREEPPVEKSIVQAPPPPNLQSPSLAKAIARTSPMSPRNISRDRGDVPDSDVESMPRDRSRSRSQGARFIQEAADLGTKQAESEELRKLEELTAELRRHNIISETKTVQRNLDDLEAICDNPMSVRALRKLGGSGDVSPRLLI